MKIINKCERKTVSFADMKFGDVFLYAHKPYMKVEYMTRCNAVSLIDGNIRTFSDPNAQYTKVTAELTLTPILADE